MSSQVVSKSARFTIERASVFAVIASILVPLLIIVPGVPAPVSPTKAFALGVGVIVTLACYVLTRLSRGGIILPPLTLFGALWIPLAAYILSTVFSGMGIMNAVFGKTLEANTLGFMLAATFLAALAALVLRKTEQYLLFFKSLAYAFGALVVLQVAILLLGQAWPSRISPSFSPIGSLTDLGMLLGLGVILVLSTLRLTMPSSQNRTALLVAGALALALLAILGSTLVWVLIALVSLALFVEAVMRRSPITVDSDLEGARLVGGDETEEETGEGNKALVAPLVVLAVSLFFLIGSNLGQLLGTFFDVGILSARPSWQSTLTVGSHVYDTMPFFGSGPATFGEQWVAYRDVSWNQTAFWNVDFVSGVGFIPTSVVTTGILGILAWLAFFGLFAFYGIRALIFRAPEDNGAHLAATLSFIGAIYIFIVALFDLPSVPLIALGFVFFGVFVSTQRFSRGAGQWGISFSRSPRVGFLVVFTLTLLLLAGIGAAYLLVERYAAEVNLTRASQAVGQNDLEGAKKALASAVTFSPMPEAYIAQAYMARADLQRIGASGDLSSAETARAFQQALADGINVALTATQIAPKSYEAWLSLANLYAYVVPLRVEGAYENAKTAYEKAAELSPTNPIIPFSLAQIAIAQGENDAAREHLKRAIALKQDYPAAIFTLSQLEVRAGNLAEALAAAEAAAYFTPSDPNVLFQVGLLRAASNNLQGSAVALSAAVTANPQFANARYFLAAVYAKAGDLPKALEEVQAIAALSPENAGALAQTIADLQAGKNPFPANLLSGSAAPVTEGQ